MVNFKSLALGAALALGAFSFANASSSMDDLFPPITTTFENPDGRNITRTIKPLEESNLCYAFEGTDEVCFKLRQDNRPLNQAIKTGTAPQDGVFVADNLFYDDTFNALFRLKQKTVTPMVQPYVYDDTAPRRPLEHAPMTRQKPQSVTSYVTEYIPMSSLPDAVQDRIKNR